MLVQCMKFISTVTMALGGLLLLAVPLRSATEYVEGEVIVTFRSGATKESAKGLLKKKSMAFSERFERLSEKRNRQTGLVRDKTKTTRDLIAALKNDPNIESVEPNYLRWFNATPNDTAFAQLWALQNTGQSITGSSGTPKTGTVSADISFLAARDLARSPQGDIVVGVLDTGIDYVHPDLAANIWTNVNEIPFNGIDDDANGYTDDYHGYDFANADPDASDDGTYGDHGTHVAGTIGAVGNNQIGIIGVNDRVRLLPLKVSANGVTISSAAVIAALDYVTALKQAGVNIVALNASFGGGGSSSAEIAAIQAAGDQGIIFCAAAGNDSSNNNTSSEYPASYRLANMIVVAATDQNDVLSSFSNYGSTTVDIAAPGSNIYSTKPSTVSVTAGGVSYSSDAFFYAVPTTGVSGTIVDCGTGNTAGEFPPGVSGNIALIQRGDESFATKLGNAMAAGAIGAIIYNNVTGSITGTLSTYANWIPVRAISMDAGALIKAALPLSGAIIVTGQYQYLNGTSMATPHVTGAVAFAAMNFPGDTLAQRKARVLAAVDVKSGLQGKVITGGRLNLARIVDANSDSLADWQPVITTTSLALAINGESYVDDLAATNGSTPYAWSVAAGTLPSGITLGGDGVFAGIGTVNGSYVFTARVTDDYGATSTKSLTLEVADSGPLDHFAWDYLPASVYSDTPFAVRISARDAEDRLVTSAGDSVMLSAAEPVTETALSLSPSSASLTAGEFLGYLTVTTASSDAILTVTGSVGAVAGHSITIQSKTSSAADGVPDTWKDTFGLNTAVDAATVDSDGDGLTDLQEYHAGTNPLSSTSTLTIESASIDAENNFNLSFPAVEGKLYRISTSTDLNTWTPLIPYILPDSSGQQSVHIELGEDPKVFFRVEIAE